MVLQHPIRIALALMGCAFAAPAWAAENRTSSGTGVIVNADGYLVTNAHVARGCEKATASTVGGAAVKAELIAKDERNDIAVMRAKLPNISYATFRASKIRSGESIVVFGFPLTGLLATTGNVTTGIVASLSGLGDDSSQMQITAPVQPGNSGGPVIDANGQVIGIVVSKLNALNAARLTGDVPQNINFAIKGAMVTSFLASNDVQFETSSTAVERKTPDIVDDAKKFTVIIECYGAPPNKTAQAAPSPSVNAPAAPPPKQNAPEKPEAHHNDRIPREKIDSLAEAMASVMRKQGRQEAAKVISTSLESLTSKDKISKADAFSAIAIDLAVTVIDLSIVKKKGLEPMPFFSMDQVGKRSATLLDKISYPGELRGQLVEKLGTAGTKAIVEHLK